MVFKPGYIYEPLERPDGIRLLTVENVPATRKGRGPVRCWIQHFRISNAPPYRALSYTWGDTCTKKIILNDCIVSVRKNLWEALAHLQFAPFDFRTPKKDEDFSEGNSKWVWIDALCIDQNNTPERNHQVGIMGKIYSTAAEVIVWLGCEKDSDRGPLITAAMEALPQMNDGNTSENPTQVLDRNHEGLAALFRLPYWQRLWIVQEVGLAQNITLLFDRVTTNWEHLHNFRKLLSSAYFPNKFDLLPASTFTPTHKTDLLSSQAFRLDRHRSNSHRNLFGYLVESFQESLCTDPRDKVYGLIGLSHDCQENQLQPNYDKTLFEVYTDVIKFYNSSRRSKGPSQHTPRFAQILQQALKSNSGISVKVIEYSLSLYPPKVRPSMHVFGVTCGTITKFSGSIDLSETPEGNVSWFRPTAPPLPADLVTSLASQKKDYSHFKISTPDLRKLAPLRTRTSFAVQAQSATKDLVSKNMDRSSPSGPYLDPSRDQYLQFWLSNGQTGYSPYNALEGDIVVQFLGCDVAAILRPSQTKLVFDIIGKAFIAKSSDEMRDAESWAKKYMCAVPDYGRKFAWAPEQAVYLYLDVVTLQILTQ